MFCWNPKWGSCLLLWEHKFASRGRVGPSSRHLLAHIWCAHVSYSEFPSRTHIFCLLFLIIFTHSLLFFPQAGSPFNRYQKPPWRWKKSAAGTPLLLHTPVWNKVEATEVNKIATIWRSTTILFGKNSLKSQTKPSPYCGISKSVSQIGPKMRLIDIIKCLKTVVLLDFIFMTQWLTPFAKQNQREKYIKNDDKAVCFRGKKCQALFCTFLK